jgi:curved DNA-binding protein CbpA
MATIPPGKRVSIRPAPTNEERDRAVMRWAQVIDQLDFLAMLRLPRTERGPSEGDVRRAYRVFARGFHPDHYRDSPPAVRDAAAKVFSAGAEAYQVLMEPLMRLRYLKALSEGRIRVPPEELERATREDKRAAGQPTVSLVKTPAARRFAEKADKMIALGELAYAKSALEQALAVEPSNAALAAKLTAVEERLYAPRGGSR